jgi:hypothetical protein
MVAALATKPLLPRVQYCRLGSRVKRESFLLPMNYCWKKRRKPSIDHAGLGVRKWMDGPDLRLVRVTVPLLGASDLLGSALLGLAPGPLNRLGCEACLSLGIGSQHSGRMKHYHLPSGLSVEESETRTGIHYWIVNTVYPAKLASI